MDNIQIYLCCLIALRLGISMLTHGEEKTRKEDFRLTFVALIVGLPLYGRIFGWW